MTVGCLTVNVENGCSQAGIGAPPGWIEADRLAALLRYGILDTSPEPEFDNITRVAALICKAPMAVVNLVADTRQFFKSEIGLGVREMPLDVSICARAILEPEILVVPDLADDRRFDCNPLVTGSPHLRFYAGARLDTPEGLPLGTVCVLDYQPRPEGLTSEQQEVLRALARQTMAHLELKGTIEARDLLTRELSHRIKNVFSVVSGLASASARDRDARAFVTAFRGRIGALARAHDYVLPGSFSARNERESTVRGLLKVLLHPYDEDRRRIRITGDDLPLGQSAATTLALILHEQATNAIKYGALSNAEGRVLVDCRNGGESFEIAWEEQGGPPTAGPPLATGFGTTMVSSAIDSLGGTITAEWAAQGLQVTLSVPVRCLAG
ncbi:GAF domain-containing protein [Paracoccus sp. MC1862]|nr:GAF domain-containing protein [Paracoccus sp. MC1862]